MSIYMSRAELEEISEGLITAYANKFSNRVIQSIDIEHFITEFLMLRIEYKTLEKHWGYWCRYIYINRYMDAPKPVYQNLYDLVKEKDYFVLTTNVDHCFQKAGFAKNRIFYTQGDYGLFQCSEPCHKETYDNEEIIKKWCLVRDFRLKTGNCKNRKTEK